MRNGGRAIIRRLQRRRHVRSMTDSNATTTVTQSKNHKELLDDILVTVPIFHSCNVSPIDGRTVVHAAREYVKEHMSGWDGSHDYAHVERVVALVKIIAEKEGVTDRSTLEILELAALLHDVTDYKYKHKHKTTDTNVPEESHGGGVASPSLSAKSKPEKTDAVTTFLNDFDYPEDGTCRILNIINSIGFKKTLSSGIGVEEKKNEIKKEDGVIPNLQVKMGTLGSLETTNNGKSDKPEVSMSSRELEVAIVQDADYLDAIGAVGIARAFTFGGTKNRPLFDPLLSPLSRGELNQSNYSASSSTLDGRPQPTLNHFYEKLLLLKDLMKTKTAKEMALKRHEFMETFLYQFLDESSLQYRSDVPASPRSALLRKMDLTSGGQKERLLFLSFDRIFSDREPEELIRDWIGSFSEGPFTLDIETAVSEMCLQVKSCKSKGCQSVRVAFCPDTNEFELTRMFLLQPKHPKDDLTLSRESEGGNNHPKSMNIIFKYVPEASKSQTRVQDWIDHLPPRRGIQWRKRVKQVLEDVEKCRAIPGCKGVTITFIPQDARFTVTQLFYDLY